MVEETSNNVWKKQELKNKKIPYQPNSKELKKYFNDELTPDEAYRIEKTALEDPFLVDAMEGWEGYHAADIAADLESMNFVKASRLKKYRWPLVAAVFFVFLTGMWTYFGIFYDQKTISYSKEKITYPATEAVKANPKHGKENPFQQVPVENKLLEKEPLQPEMAATDKPKISAVPKIPNEPLNNTTMDYAPSSMAEPLPTPQEMPTPPAGQPNLPSVPTQGFNISVPVKKEKSKNPNAISKSNEGKVYARRARTKTWLNDQAALPIFGRDSLDAYIKNRTSEMTDLNGSVSLLVTFDEWGQIESIEVQNSTGIHLDSFAISIIRDGQGWKPAKKDGIAVASEKEIRITFP